MTEFVALDASINTTDWTRAVNAMIDDSGRLETALKSVSDVSEKLEKALKGGDVKVNVQVDGSMIDKAVTDLALIDGATPLVDVTVDSGQIDTAEAEVLAIDGMSPDVEIDATFAELITAESKIKNLDGEQVSVPIKTETSDADKDIADIKRDLSTLKTLAIIDFVINIPATFTAFYEQMLNLPVLGAALGFIVDTDAAVASFNARTGQTIEGLDAIIDRLHVDTGAEKGTITDTLVLIAQQGDLAADEIEDLALKSLEFSQVWGTDVNKTIIAAQQLVNTGLAKDFDEAFDILAYGMQTGADRTGDFMDAIGEFGIDFAELGLTGQEAVDIINSGLNEGVQNAGRVGEAYNGLNQQIKAGSEETQAVLDQFGIDPENVGMEGIEKLTEGLKGIESQVDRTSAYVATFGSGGIEVGEALLNTSFNEEDITGTFDGAITDIEGSMQESFAEFGRTLEVEIVKALDNAFDFTAMLERGKEAARAFIEAIQGGEGLAGAIEIALALPGFEHSFNQFEAGMGELIIAMLEVAAAVGEFLGKDVSGLRATIKDAAQTQLEFGLSIAQTPDEMEGAIASALSHGLEAPDVQSAIDSTVSEKSASGDLVGAQSLLDIASSAEIVTDDLSGMSTATRLFTENAGLNSAMVDKLLVNLDKMAAGTVPLAEGVASKEDAARDAAIIRTARIGIDLTGAQETVDKAIEDTYVAYTTALQAKDWDMAFVLGDDLGISGELISKDIVDAKVADFIATNPVNIPVGFSLDDTDFAAEEGFQDFGRGMTELEEETNQTATGVGAKFGNISSSANDMKSDLIDATDEMGGGLEEFSASAETNLGIATNSWLAFGGALTDVLNSAGPALASIIAVLGTAIGLGGEFQDVVDSAAAPAATGGGAVKPNAGHAAGTGNTGIGSFVAGEEGPEIVTTDRSLAVLNNDTTRALWAGLRAGSAMNSNVQNNRTANVYNTFNVQSQAQAVSAGQVVANKVRGY